MNKIFTELEEAILDTEGISAIMGMISDCAIEGAQSLDNYKMGFWKINEMLFINAKKLNEVKEKLFEEYEKVAK